MFRTTGVSIKPHRAKLPCKRHAVLRFDDQPELNGYHAFNAQDKYEDRGAIHRKLIIYPELMAAVRSGFDAGPSHRCKQRLPVSGIAGADRWTDAARTPPNAGEPCIA